MKGPYEKLADDFIKVCRIAELEITRQDMDLENLAPGSEHRELKPLPKGKMAVYIFEKDPQHILKVGKVFEKSSARYKQQHYSPASSNSNLAKSLLNDGKYSKKFDKQTVGDWIKDNTRRINMLLPASRGVFTLNLLEAFLHARLRPKYEG
jgi:hypothetical protein